MLEVLLYQIWPPASNLTLKCFKLGNGHFCPLRYQGWEICSEIPLVYALQKQNLHVENFAQKQVYSPKFWPKFLTFGNGLIDFNGEKKFLLLEGEENECLPKFGVLIFILAHEIKKVCSLSTAHVVNVFPTGVKILDRPNWSLDRLTVS